MKIYYDSKDPAYPICEIKDIGENVEEPSDITFNIGQAIASIIGEMMNQMILDKPWEKKKELADAIIDFTKDIVDMYYDAMEKQHEKAKKEVELYEIMVECYEETLRNYDIDEDEIISDAQTMTSRFVVEQNGGTYHCNIVFGDKVYTFGKVPAGLTGKKMDLLTWKASLAAIVLFDKAFPDDESKHPLRPYNKFNFYQDLIDEL